jgi:hypothetical protein
MGAARERPGERRTITWTRVQPARLLAAVTWSYTLDGEVTGCRWLAGNTARRWWRRTRA